MNQTLNGEKLPPWEASQFSEDGDSTVSVALRHSFSQKGYETVEQIEKLLDTDYGQRLVDKFCRHCVVQFKNGVRKTVRPTVDLSLITKSEKFIEMADKIRANRRANSSG